MYTHWGSHDCWEGTLLYDGFIAGGAHTQYGGGANYLCMHPLPQYPIGYDDGDQNGNRLYGSEYQGTSNAAISGTAK